MNKILISLIAIGLIFSVVLITYDGKNDELNYVHFCDSKLLQDVAKNIDCIQHKEFCVSTYNNCIIHELLKLEGNK